MKLFRKFQAVSNYQLARIVEDMDAVRRDRRNTITQRNEADELMFLAEGALYDRQVRP